MARSAVVCGHFCGCATLLLSVGLVLGQGPARPETAASSTVSGPAWPVEKRVYDPHFEVPDQGIVWTSPVQSGVTAQGGPVVFGPYVSVQVNVNALGNNIAGDAANEPSIAIDPTNPNRMAIGWRQFNTISSNFRQAGRAYSIDGGQTWTFPGVIQPGQFRSDPVLAADAFGNFYYSSLSSTTSVEVFKSSDGGVSWSGPVGAFGGDKQWIAVDRRSAGTGAGYIAQFWNVQFSCCPPNDFTRSTNGALFFQSPIPIPEPSMKWGTMDAGPDGTLYLVGASVDQDGHVFARSSDASNPFVTPTFDFVKSINLGGLTGGFAGFAGPNPDGLIGQVWVASHPTLAGRVFVLGSVAPPSEDPQELMIIRSLDNGLTWSSPVRINDDPPGTNAWQWFGALSVAPNGRLDATWYDTRTTGQANQSALFYSYSMDGGATWSTNVQVSPVFNSHVGFPQQNKLGDYTHSLSDHGGVNLTYAATFNGEQDVYFIRIPQDCNANGIDDNCDVTCGAPGTRCDVAGCGMSTDCSNNAVPDECEPDDDCNGNLTRDICEIGADPSLDCNLNRILDACESTADCNENEINDLCDLADGTSGDCNENGQPDECDIASMTSDDRDGNGVPDECVGACCACAGCEPVTPNECAARNGDFGGLETICADDVCFLELPANDLCQNASQLPGAASFSVPFDNRCAGSDGPGSVNCPGAQPFGTDLWYTYVAPCTGTIRVSLCDTTNFDTMLGVYGGGPACTCPSDNSTLLTCGDDTCGIGGGPSRVDVSVTAGRCYTIRLGGWSGSIGAGEVSVSYLTQCTPASPLLHEPNGKDKNRFISLVAPLSLAGENHALRVRLTSLHHPLSPADAPDFSAHEGGLRYVNTIRDSSDAVVTDCIDSVTFATTFKCARLGCSPEYRDWAAQFGGEPAHITGDAIVPSSIYHVSLLPADCAGQEATCTNASAELQLTTSRFGDVEPGTLDVIDLGTIIDRVRNIQGTIIAPRGLLHPEVPNPTFHIVNVIDIGLVVDALKNLRYPFGISACP